MVAVYKITSPDNLVYIGKSKDVERRINEHKTNCQNLILIKSFFRHGVESHVFEIIEECSLDELNKREAYFIDLYNKKGVLFNVRTFNHVQYKRNVPPEIVKKLDEQLELLKRERKKSIENLIANQH